MSAMSVKILCSWILGVLIDVSAGGLIWREGRPECSRGPTQTRQEGFKFINPLLECALSEPVREEPVVRLRRALEDSVEHEKQHERASAISVYFRDLNNGPWTGVDYDRPFHPASLYKVPVMMAYLEAQESNPALFETRIRFTRDERIERSYLADQSHRPPLENGVEYTVEELLDRMITDSDNDAAALLTKFIAPEQLASIYERLGIPDPAQGGPHEAESVRTYATFLRLLYNASYLSKRSSEYAL